MKSEADRLMDSAREATYAERLVHKTGTQVRDESSDAGQRRVDRDTYNTQMQGCPVTIRQLTNDEKLVCDFLAEMARGESIEDFGYLLLTDDPQCNEEAIRRIKGQFKDYRREHGKS